MAAKTEAPARDVIVTRVFKAPRALVWQAWTDATMFQRWYGPKDFTAQVARMDVRVGGSFLWGMRHPRGMEYWTTGIFREVEPTQRLVYTDSPADAQGNRVAPSHYGMPGDTLVESLVTVVFEDADGGTRLTLRQSGLPAAAGAEGGWNQAFDKLAAAIAKE